MNGQLVKKSHWADIREVGSAWGINVLAAIFRFVGTPILRVILYPVVTYFFLRNRVAREASREYLTRLAAFAPSAGIVPSLGTSFRHFMAFASSLVDRVAAWSGRIELDELMLTGRETLMRTIESGTGVMLLGAHLGNLEVTRALSRLRPNVRLNVIIHTRNAERFNAMLRKVSGDSALTLIEATDISPGVAIRLREKLASGELVVIAGDRIPLASTRVSRASFLGSEATFPQGPIVLAALLKCPVFILLCIKEPNGYHMHCVPFAERVVLDRRDRSTSIERYVQRYARELERYCVASPLQWFNFYPFWAPQLGAGTPERG